MIAAVCSAKGSPGATTTALALAPTSPRRPVLLEADPDGGDLAVRCRHRDGRDVAKTPNLLSLATSVRATADAGTDPALIDRFTQTLACGVELVPGPGSLAQARALGGLWPRIAHAVAHSHRDVIIDLGRLRRGDATTPLASAADVVIVVCRPHLESVLHAQHLIADLAPALVTTDSGPAFLPLVVTSHRDAAADTSELNHVMSALGGLPLAPAVAIAHDPRATADLENGANPQGRLARTPLLSTARSLIDDLMHVTDNRSATVSALWEIGARR